MPGKKKLISCPDCETGFVQADAGYRRPARDGELGKWTTVCIGCHIRDDCVGIGADHGAAVASQPRTVPVEINEKRHQKAKPTTPTTEPQSVSSQEIDHAQNRNRKEAA